MNDKVKELVEFLIPYLENISDKEWEAMPETSDDFRAKEDCRKYSACVLRELADKFDLALIKKGELPKLPSASGECPVCGGSLKAVPPVWGEGGGLYCKGTCNCYTDTERYRKLFLLKMGYLPVIPLAEAIKEFKDKDD